jgi:histone deacetylase 1/2
MENANSYEYLEKIKIAVIENLKKTAPVPSVQMQDVPREGLGLSDEQEAELDDLDEDDNKDVRLSQRQWEKRVERLDEYEDSDDEDMARANGVYKANGRSRQETNHGITSKEDDAMDVDSGVATPAEPAADTAADNDDTMIDEAQADTTEAEGDTAASAVAEKRDMGDEPKVDGDGDHDMSEAAPEKNTDATIKTEEVEGISATEPEHNTSAADGGLAAGNNENLEALKRASGSPEASGAEAKLGKDAAPATETSDKDGTASGTQARGDATKN